MYQAKRTVIGIFAYVDAGKTTLSESILYVSGAGRRQGSVDKRTSVLDSNETERLRGITIFGSQASFSAGKHNFTLIDTPGHVDFSTEAERSMSVLDYAVLVISASEGIKPHTETLWKLLHRYSVPVFLFVNKCDLPNVGRKAITEQLCRKLSSGCIDLYGKNFTEEAALTDESLMDARKPSHPCAIYF